MMAGAQEQPTRCFTNEGPERLLYDTAYANRVIEREKLYKDCDGAQSRSADSTLYIPVVVHVIHNGGSNNITDAQVVDMIRVINEDFTRTNADTNVTRAIFQDVAASANIEFRLATKDENGNCTSGITRHYSELTTGFPNNFKEVVSWDNSMYLNIFIVNSIYHVSNSGIVGYARFPEVGGQTMIEDGVVARYFSVGAIGQAGAGFPQYDRGRTVTHEVGHYLNLLHPFHGLSCSNVPPYFHNDNCTDTPRSNDESFNCEYNKNTCGSGSGDKLDMVENFMDYSDDDCANIYTICQTTRARNTLEDAQLRAILVSASNRAATGIMDAASPCKPGADAYPNKQSTCVGSSINFKQNAYGDAYTSLKWILSGTNANNSTNPNVNGTYSTPGTYDFGLIATNAEGSDTIVFEKSIVVVDDVGKGIPGGYFEDFETNPPAGEWNIQHSGMRNHFARTSQASSSGNWSYWVNNFAQAQASHTTPVQSRDVERLYMPPLDMTSLQTATLKFKYAYCQRRDITLPPPYDKLGGEELLVQFSTNCGQSWITRKTITNADLQTSGFRTTAFYPTNSSQWAEASVPLNAYASFDHVMIRFVLDGGAGNNFFIDDISVTDQFSSVEEMELNSLEAYPNPFEEKFFLRFESSAFQKVSVTIMDLQGKTMHSANLQSDIGMNEFSFDTQSWAKGIYLVQVEDSFGAQVKKLVKE